MSSAGENGFRSVAMRVVGGLALTGILGMFGVAYAQVALKTKVERNESDIAAVQRAAAAVPVIQRDIEHVKEDVQEIKSDISKIESAITKIAEDRN